MDVGIFPLPCLIRGYVAVVFYESILVQTCGIPPMCCNFVEKPLDLAVPHFPVSQDVFSVITQNATVRTGL